MHYQNEQLTQPDNNNSSNEDYSMIHKNIILYSTTTSNSFLWKGEL